MLLIKNAYDFFTYTPRSALATAHNLPNPKTPATFGKGWTVRYTRNSRLHQRREKKNQVPSTQKGCSKTSDRSKSWFLRSGKKKPRRRSPKKNGSKNHSKRSFETPFFMYHFLVFAIIFSSFSLYYCITSHHLIFVFLCFYFIFFLHVFLSYIINTEV